MATAIVRDNHLTFNGIKYFRANSEEIELGSYGNKRAPIFGANYLEVYKNLPFAKLEIDKPLIVDIDFTSTKSSDLALGAGFKVLGAGVSANVSNVYSKLQSAELSLVKFSVKSGDMVDAINKSPSARDKIDDLGNSARVAHQVFVVMDAKLATTMAKATSFDVGVSAGDISITAAGKVAAGQTNQVVLSEGSTFCYLLLDLTWDHRNKNKRTKVISAKDDQWSLN